MSEVMYGRTMFDNESGHPDELSFQKADILTVLKTQIDGAPGWWLCRKGTKVGIAPGNYIEKLPADYTPPIRPTDTRLDKIDQRSSRAPSGDYSHPRNPKMLLREGESQLNVQHRQVEEASDRVNAQYASEVLKCDEYDVMKWRAVVKHFWSLCEDYSGAILLFTKFVRSSVLETIDENVDFVVVGKLSNRLNTLDLDFQGYTNLLKISKLQFNENTSKNIHVLIERGEKLPAQITEIYATLKANKNMFFSEEAPKWAANQRIRRASYEDVDCMDFLTQAMEVRNRNDLKIDVVPDDPPARKSAPSSPNRVRDLSGLKGRSRSKTELLNAKLSIPLPSSDHSRENSVRENKFSSSISQHLGKLKLKSNQRGFFKSAKISSNNKIEISSPSNPQMLQSVTSNFAVSKARAVTMTTPLKSNRRATSEADILEDLVPMDKSLPLSPGGGYESMSGVTNFSSLPLRESNLKTTLEVSILTELYLQLEQVLSCLNESTRRLKVSIGTNTPDPLVYTPLIQNMTSQIFKTIFLLQASQSKLQSNETEIISKIILDLYKSAKNIISKSKELLKIDSNIQKELSSLSEECVAQLSRAISGVMSMRDDSMSGSDV